MEKMQKSRKNKQNKMENIKMSPTKGDKIEVLCREILWKINDIGQKTYKLKKDVNDICGIILRKPGGTFFFEGRKAELWKEASDDFSQQWKEIGAEKYEVECMVHLMYDLVLQKEEKCRGKIVLSTKRRATSVVK